MQTQHTMYTENTESSYEPYEDVLDPKVTEFEEPPPEDLVEKDFGRVRCKPKYVFYLPSFIYVWQSRKTHQMSL